jgi:predicted membrane protein
MSFWHFHFILVFLFFCFLSYFYLRVLRPPCNFYSAVVSYVFLLFSLFLVTVSIHVFWKKFINLGKLYYQVRDTKKKSKCDKKTNYVRRRRKEKNMKLEETAIKRLKISSFIKINFQELNPHWFYFAY